jgi:predicted glycogen debranching enzyme
MDATNPLVDHVLLRAIKKFVVKRDELKTVMAGYPWFLDWGRDTLICVRGMLSAWMLDDVKKILLQFGKYSENGTLPNTIHGNVVANRDTSDAPLWFFVACGDYCFTVGNYDILNEKVDENRTLLEALKSIATGYINGTPNGIKVDPDSDLVFSPFHFTWMDTNYPAGTPREGYPIEIQALWYYALKFLGIVDKQESAQWLDMAQKVAESVKKYFVMDYFSSNGRETGKKYLSDCLHCSGFKPAKDAQKDDHIRPNQIFAISLGLVTDYELSRGILESSYELLIPGAIRSLADRPTVYPLPIYRNNTRELLNDPINPYWGEYSGEEDTRRKPAYHNGTAWVWPFPSYCEAYYKVYGKAGLAHARSILFSALQVLEEGCLGQLPEILDGNFPHKQRGCDAQAWSVMEYYRVWKLLHN